MSFLTKGTVVAGYGFFALVFASLIALGWSCDQRPDIQNVYWCSYEFSESITWLVYTDIMLLILIFPVFVTLVQTPNVFENWKWFAVWATPVIIVVTWWLLSIDTGGDIGGLVADSIILTALFATYAIYLLISLTIIAVTWYKNRS